MTHTKEYIKKVREVFSRDYIRLEDGFYVLDTDNRCIDSSQLRIIADHLDELNAPWAKQIEDYFEKTS